MALATAAAALFVSACGSSTSSSDGTSATAPADEAGTVTSDEAVTSDETGPDAAAGAGNDTVVNGETDAPVPTYEIDEALVTQQFLPASSCRVSSTSKQLESGLTATEISIPTPSEAIVTARAADAA